MSRLAVGGAAAALLLAAAALSGCSAPPPGAAPSPQAPTLGPSPTVHAEAWWRAGAASGTLASGLSSPWSVVPLAGGGALISQRDDGAVLEVTAGGDVRRVDTIPGVVSGGESGLHGLALREESGTRLLYAYFGAAEDNRVVRMPLLGEPGSYALGPAEVVVAGIPRASTHDGGRLAFGPDGHLYITTGDAQQRDAAQDPAILGGKILRVTPEGEPAPGNPWGTEVYSIGHRNVQGIAWTADGTLWASEFGQNTWDELNRIEAGGNYGWPVVEGAAGREDFIEPVVTWATSEASPSGIAAYGDTVFVAGLRGERLWQVDTTDGELVRSPVAALDGAHGRLRDVVAVSDGSLWVLTGNTDGRGAPRADDDRLLRVELTPAT
ncbi:PQQ-dependent sugar dehydrogenase [Microbacterium atlanticum]|uniref:PQQ-dependent sugar dehydrogenase n=1 Tax=Microbacterium atlanticum TaxID=2782168 RepID=UPI00188982F7|nr:PQQ-dependent sugar dehydrogenase [Microbacterium atlanticum]